MKKMIMLMAMVSVASLQSTPVRSLVAARNAVISESEQKQYTAKDYIQDGLVAMWDGIENAGWGVHDDNATMWKELVGIMNPSQTGALSFNTDCAIFNGGAYINTTYAWPNRCPFTFEVIFEVDSNQSRMFILDCMNNGGWRFARNASNTGNVMNLVVRYARNSQQFINTTYIARTKNKYVGIVDSSHMQLERNMQLISDIEIPDGVYSTDVNIIHIGSDINESYMYNGRMNCVRIYNRTLTLEEIAYNNNIDKARFNLP